MRIEVVCGGRSPQTGLRAEIAAGAAARGRFRSAALSRVGCRSAGTFGGGRQTGPDVPIYDLHMCGRVIQSSGPLRYAIVDGLDMRDNRLSNYPRRWNGAPSQELVVIVVIAMIVSRLIAPGSKLATARGLDPATAVSSLGEALGLGRRRRRTLRRPGLASRPAAGHREEPGQEAPRRRRAGPLRRHLKLRRGALLLLGQARLQPRRQEGQAADRLRPLVRRRRLPGGGRSVRRRHRRSQDPLCPDRAWRSSATAA